MNSKGLKIGDKVLVRYTPYTDQPNYVVFESRGVVILITKTTATVYTEKIFTSHEHVWGNKFILRPSGIERVLDEI